MGPAFASARYLQQRSKGGIVKRTGSMREARKRKFDQSLEVARNLFGKSMSESRLRRIAETMVGRPARKLTQRFPLKHERLAQLARAGFNVADYRAWPCGQLNTEELRDFFGEYKTLSLRNFIAETGRPDDPSPRLPFLKEQGDWEAILKFCGETNVFYHTLVNEAIPADDALYAGNVVLLDPDRYVISYAVGGTPRDVDEKLESWSPDVRMFMRTRGAKPSDNVPAELHAVGEMALSFLPALRPITMEFNVYPYSVGMLSQNEVFWEYRGGTTHDLFCMVERMLESASSSNLRVQMAE